MKSFFLIFLCIIIGCKNTPTETFETSANTSETTQQFDQLEKLEWLLGNWSHVTSESASFETWKQENDSTWVAHSYTLVEKDTVFAEKIRLKQRQDMVYFTAHAYLEEEDVPVTFTLIDTTAGNFVFENKAHDFPTQIIYSHPAQDSIHAWITGTVEGEPKKVDFYFTRDKK